MMRVLMCSLAAAMMMLPAPATAKQVLKIEAVVNGKKAKGVRCRIESPEITQGFGTPHKLKFRAAKDAPLEISSISCIYRGTISRITEIPEGGVKRIRFHYPLGDDSVEFLTR